jgi:pimeloyl-ACP methyl ester carboxylesterase
MKTIIRVAISVALIHQAKVPAATAPKDKYFSAVVIAQSGPRKPGEIVIEKASIISNTGETIDFDLGTLYVPENRADPKSRVIRVGFARVPALQPTGAPAIFHLPGGPGGSFLDGLKPGNNGKHPLAWDTEYYRSISDSVYIDQRGASERGDVLKFRYHTIEHPLDQPFSIDREVAAFTDFTHKAVAEFTQKGFDLRGYNVKECAEDVNDLRKALGYKQITLVGQSFGSQWSFAVMRTHPEIVARALLSGVEPLDYGYDMPSHVFAAVQRTWWEAEQQPQIKPYLPSGGLMQVTREVLQRLRRSPIKVTVKDPKTGQAATITLGPGDLQMDFPMGDKGPAILLSLYYEHYDDWARTVLKYRHSREAEEMIIGPLIDTSLGVSPRRKYLLKNDPAKEFLGEWDFASYLATADIWPTPDVGDDFRTEVVNRIPVVFVEGDWDTSTPIENTLYVAPYFLNGRVLIVEHGKHAALKKIEDQAPEILIALLAFLKTGNTEELPARITLPVPKFDVPTLSAGSIHR